MIPATGVFAPGADVGGPCGQWLPWRGARRTMVIRYSRGPWPISSMFWIVLVVAHTIGDDRGHERLDGAQHRHGERPMTRVGRRDVGSGNAEKANFGRPLGIPPKARADGFQREDAENRTAAVAPKRGPGWRPGFSGRTSGSKPWSQSKG